MGKECGAWVSRRLWGGGNTSPLKTTAWEATKQVCSQIMISLLLTLLIPCLSCQVFLKMSLLYNSKSGGV